MNNSVLVVGSVAYDSVNTPSGTRENALGGSATYFSISASYFNHVSLVAVVGDDFLAKDFDLLRSKNINTADLQKVSGKTFRWKGSYDFGDLNQRETISTDLNVFADFKPILSKSNQNAPYVFLANIDPDLQLEVLDQMVTKPEISLLDSMNYWIDNKFDSLEKVLRRINILILDVNEIKEFTSKTSIEEATKTIQERYGVKFIVVKNGEHGSTLWSNGLKFNAPPYKVAEIIDPTGAGDSFAGGFTGYLTKLQKTDLQTLKKAMIYGNTMGSFAVETFSVDKLVKLSISEIENRAKSIMDKSNI